MKTKKSKRANLENYRTIFLQIGLILSLSAILFAFEWKTAFEMEKLNMKSTQWTDIEDFPPPTRSEVEAPPEVKPPSFELDIVDDGFEIDDIDLEHLISEIGEGEEIKIIEFNDDRDEDVIEDFIKVEIKPKFNGKDARYFSNYVASNLEFPREAAEIGISGTVKAAFIIAEDGSVSNVEIIRSVHPTIDKSVIEAIKKSPKWEPGIQRGKSVKVRFEIAIKFDLI